MPISPPLPNRGVRLLVALVLALSAGVVLVRELPGSSHPVPKDFAQYYVAGKVILAHEPGALYFTDIVTGLTTDRFPGNRFQEIAAASGIQESSYFIYPPWVGALYAPVTVLSPYRALVAVYLASWILTVLALALLARELPRCGWAASAAVFALLIQTESYLQAIRAGQASIPVLLLLVLFARALWRHRDTEAGIWLALLIGIKLFPVLYLPYLAVARRGKALIATAASGAVLLAFSVAVAGVPAHLRFLGLMLQYIRYSTTLASNQSVTGFFFRLLAPADARHWTVLRIPPEVAWPSRITVLAWMGATLWLVDRLRRRGGAWWEPLAFSLATVWVFSSAANVWVHHLVGLALPFAVGGAALLDRAGRSRRRDWALWGAGWAGLLLFPAFSRLGAAGNRYPFLLLASLPLAGAVALYLLLFRLSLAEGVRGGAAARSEAV